MEYIAIDKELYNEIVATVSTASQEIREEYRLYQESIGSEWIENDELSRLLSLSKHQLKRLSWARPAWLYDDWQQDLLQTP